MTRRVRTAAALLLVISHPDRELILDALMVGPSSSKLMAGRLERQLENLSYHVRALRDAGLIRKRRVRMVKGAVQTFYEITPLGRRAREVIAAARVAVEGPAVAPVVLEG